MTSPIALGGFTSSLVKQTIANGLPAIAVPGAQTIAVGKAAAISGVSVSETGNTSGETFTVTLADINGLLSATGGDIVEQRSRRLTLTGLSLAALNADLATLRDTDATAGATPSR